MGDDEIDAAAIRWAGVGVTVPAAMPGALAAAGYVTGRPAGRGAVREVCDRLLAARRARRHETRTALPASSCWPRCRRRRGAERRAGSSPAKNWVLPLFTKEGFRSMTLSGDEVHPVSSDRIDVVNILITVFSGDASARRRLHPRQPRGELLSQASSRAGGPPPCA